MGKLKDIVTSIQVGAPVKDLGRADEVIIRFKDKLISILESPDDGEIKSLSWMYDNELHTHTPVKDFWQASPPKGKG